MGPDIKYPYVGSIRWAFFKWADIPSKVDPTKVYLRRLRIIQTPRGALYLHFIYESDSDRDPHDHPANFWTFVLKGGYTEVVYTQPRILLLYMVNKWKRFSFHRMPINSAHKITQLHGKTITLVFFGKRQKSWGFWTPEGIIPYQEYVDG